MSLKSLMSHRCDLYDLVSTDNDGSPVTRYQKVNPKPVRCRIDLTFTRPGKDSLWMGTAARVEDRMGVMFFMLDTPIKAGMRIVMTRGPEGIFQLKGSIDPVAGFVKGSHLEVGVMEVSTLQWREPVSQTPGEMKF